MTNIKNFKRLYKINRLWGDGVWVASYWALRGKAFIASLRGRILETQITQDKIEDAWWEAIK